MLTWASCQLARARAPQSGSMKLKHGEPSSMVSLREKHSDTAWQGKHVVLHPQGRPLQKGNFSPLPAFGTLQGLWRITKLWFASWTLETACSEQGVLWLHLSLYCVLKDTELFLLPWFWSEDSYYGIWREFSLRNPSSTTVTKSRPWDTVILW